MWNTTLTKKPSWCICGVYVGLGGILGWLKWILSNERLSLFKHGAALFLAVVLYWMWLLLHCTAIIRIKKYVEYFCLHNHCLPYLWYQVPAPWSLSHTLSLSLSLSLFLSLSLHLSLSLSCTQASQRKERCCCLTAPKCRIYKFCPCWLLVVQSS